MQGYSFEVVVSATKNSVVFPLLASVGTASVKETTTFDPKIDDLPAATKNVAADSGYDSNHVAAATKMVEFVGSATPCEFPDTLINN